MARLVATVLGGATSGLVAGLAMGIAALWHAHQHDVSAWTPALLVAAFWTGVDALVGDWRIAALGVATHLGWSMILGVVYASITRRPTTLAALASGLLFATVVWFVMTWILIPLVDPVMYQRIRWIETPWFLFHLVFGAGLALTPAIERPIAIASEPMPAPVPLTDG